MSTNNTLRKSKRVAYEKRQEEKGKKVVNWIFGILVALAVAFMVYSVILAS